MVYQQILEVSVRKALTIHRFKTWNCSYSGCQLDACLWLTWAIRGVSSSCCCCSPDLRERDMCPDVLSMCLAALMALFSERSRKVRPSADDEGFRSFWLRNSVVACFLLLEDAQSGDEHNLNQGTDVKKCDIGSDRDRRNYWGGGGVKVDYSQKRKRTHILERWGWRCSAASHRFSHLVAGICISVRESVTV